MEAMVAVAFQTAPFVLYGLDHRWAGLRRWGGSGGSDGRTDRVTLAHGDAPWEPTSPEVMVETRQPTMIGDNAEANRALELALVTREQVNALWMATGTLRDDVRRAAFPIGGGSSDPTAPWETATLAIDGTAVAFRVLTEGHCWVAHAAHHGVVVAITARAWPVGSTGLVTIEDFTPYENGSRETTIRMRSHYGYG